MPEGRQIFVSLTVHDNLLLGTYTRSDGDIARDIDRIYDRFPNLARRRNMAASVLSGERAADAGDRDGRCWRARGS